MAQAICTSITHKSRELKIYEHLGSIESPDHPWKRLTRKLFSSFQVEEPHGTHLCLIYEPRVKVSIKSQSFSQAESFLLGP